MSQPLVSVTIPCYNVGPLLSRALASVLAQSYEAWECTVVDDGSQDGVDEIVAAAGDDRIRYIRHEVNRGRAVARQTALDESSGTYLAKLDADDWLYPDKLASQVALLEENSDVSLVSSGIAIEDAQGDLVGVRARGKNDECTACESLTTLQPPPIAHAPSLIRMSVAKQVQYDEQLCRSEDADFLLKILLHNRFCVMHAVTYAYSEYRSTNRRAILSAYRWRMRMFWRYKQQYPLASAHRTLDSAIKWAAYYGAFTLGWESRLLNHRSDGPIHEDRVAFTEARRRVNDVLEQRFPAELRPSFEREVEAHG